MAMKGSHGAEKCGIQGPYNIPYVHCCSKQALPWRLTGLTSAMTQESLGLDGNGEASTLEGSHDSAALHGVRIVG